MKKVLVSVLIAVQGLFVFSYAQDKSPKFFPALEAYCKSVSLEFDQIPDERKADLKEISDFIVDQRKNHKPANLLFVCTSNSRRSHMSQVWAQVASYYYRVDSVFSFSGGTEQTRVNPNVLDAFSRAGIEIFSNDEAENALRYVKISNQIHPWAIFSKQYWDSTNPKKHFAAVMVCSEADHSCPVVEGAEMRIGLPFQDPKEFDNSPLKSAKYDERCRQIARELFFVMDQVRRNL